MLQGKGPGGVFGCIRMSAATLHTRDANSQICSLWLRLREKLLFACAASLCMSLLVQTMLCSCLVGPFAVCLGDRGLSVRVIFICDFSKLVVDYRWSVRTILMENWKASWILEHPGWGGARRISGTVAS